MRQRYLGLMSGTSIDSIDAALIEYRAGQFSFLDALNLPIDQSLRQSLLELCQATTVDLDLVGACDRDLGQLFADSALQLLHQAKLKPSDVRAIGCHGQTIRHRPTTADRGPFTWQIGDPNIIALRTGIDTVADFRRMDMAAGGQAAPLAPIFHQALFGTADCNRTLLNIGGMSNVTWLPTEGDIKGFDLGPGNALMDGWIARHLKQSYDHNGNWADGGTADPELLARLLNHPFFGLAPPKSTGREDFHLQWLDSHIAAISKTITAQDVQATLLELTAQTIAQGIQSGYLGEELYVCGGGAHNTALMSRLTALLTPTPVASTDQLYIAPDWVEACGFAWLAHQRIAQLAGNHSAVTGARTHHILGGLYCGLPVRSEDNLPHR